MDDQKKSLLWEKYKHDIEIHRSYLDLALKMNIFYYAITGAIMSFYFLHIKDEPLVRYSLILPFCMSVAFAVFFFRSALASRPSHDELLNLARALDFEVFSVVAKVLETLLWIFFVMVVVTAIGLFGFFFKDFFGNIWSCF